MDTDTILIGAGITGVVLISITGIWFFNALKNINREFKEIQRYVILVASIWVLYTMFIVFLGVTKTGPDTRIAFVLPIIYLITSIFFMFGIHNYMKQKELNYPFKQ